MHGTAESVAEVTPLFAAFDRKLKIFTKKDSRPRDVLDFAGRFEMPERRPLASLEQLADRKVAEQFGPPGILVDENMDVLQFRGGVGPFLAPSAGAATLNVTKLVRVELLPALRSALQQAATQGEPVTSEDVSLHADHGESAITLDVTPLHVPDMQQRCYLILFRASPPQRALAAGAAACCARRQRRQADT